MVEITFNANLLVLVSFLILVKKDRQQNDQKKKDNRTSNDLQNITQKMKDRAT
jgi:hypothetical protein